MSDLRARGWSRRSALLPRSSPSCWWHPGVGHPRRRRHRRARRHRRRAGRLLRRPHRRHRLHPRPPAPTSARSTTRSSSRSSRSGGCSRAVPWPRQSIDQAELRTILTEEFDRQSPPDYVAANERLYKSLGLIPADSSLRDLTLDMLSGGVVGFYRNDQGKLYVVSKDGLPGVERADHVRPRVRPRAPGPELLRCSRTRTASSTSPTGSSPGRRSSRAIRRC